jgi:hypothetical protein
MKQVSVVLLLVILLAACSQQANPNAELAAQAGSWQKLGGALDYTVAKSAVAPQLLQDRSGNLIAAWAENNNGWRVYLERWTGSGWQSFGAGTPVGSSSSFAVSFDSSNSPVVALYSSASTTNYQSKVAVYRQDASSKVWKQLGTSFTGPTVLAADASGAIYSVLYDKLDPISGPRGKNLIRRWNGSSWQTTYTFQKIIPNYQNGNSDTDAAITSLKFQSNGKPAIGWWAAVTEQRNSLSRWNGTSWIDDPIAKHEDFIDLDRKDQGLSFSTRFSPATGSNVTTVTQAGQGILSINTSVNALSTNGYSLTVDNSNRPIISLNDPYKGDLTVRRFNGQSWINLGGVIDRVPTKYANYSDIFVDTKGTIYAAWSECVGTLTAEPVVVFYNLDTCTNWNVYVSKFVP